MAKIGIYDLQKFIGIEISNNLHKFVDHTILPQKKIKKLLEKTSSYEEDIAVWNSMLLLFFLNRGRAPKKLKGFRFCFRCPIWMKQNPILGFFDLLNMMQISHLHQQPSIFTCKISPLWPYGQFFSKKLSIRPIREIFSR